MLDDEATNKRAAHMKEMQAENKRMAQQKRDRENAWKNDQAAQNKFEISVTNNSNIMTENRDTTVNSLGESRYVPYHFKGLRPDQIEDINAQRAQ